MDKGDKVKIYEKMATFDQNKVPENYTKNWPATCKKKFLAAMFSLLQDELVSRIQTRMKLREISGSFDKQTYLAEIYI